MDIKDIAALVQIRNYAFSVREDRNIFKGETYKKVSEQIVNIDKFLGKVLTETDLVQFAQNQGVIKEFDKNMVNDSKRTVNFTTRVFSTATDLSSQLSLFKDNEESDEELIARRIAEEKAKLSSKKKTKNK